MLKDVVAGVFSDITQKICRVLIKTKHNARVYTVSLAESLVAP